MAGADEGLLRLQTEGSAEVVRTGLGATLADLPVDAPFVPHLPTVWANLPGMGVCDGNGHCEWGDDISDIDTPTTSPMTWSAVRTALGAAATAAYGLGEPPVALDHSGVTP